MKTVLLGSLIQSAFCKAGSMMHTGRCDSLWLSKRLLNMGILIAGMALPAVVEDDAARSAQDA